VALSKRYCILALRRYPFTDDVSALLTITWPLLREAVAGHVVAFDAKRVPDNFGGAVAVVAVDCLLKKVRHGYALSREEHNAAGYSPVEARGKAMQRLSEADPVSPVEYPAF